MLFKHWFSLFMVGLCFSLKAYGQQEDAIIDNILESVAAEHEDEEIDLSDLTNQLYFYKKHPLNLNKASAEEMHALYLLNDLQINAIKEHIQKFGPLLDLAELQTIDLIDKQTILKLKPFVGIEQAFSYSSLIKDWRSKSENEFFVRVGSVLETPEGYKNGNYLGNKLRVYTRYSYVLSNNLNLTIQAEKDAGEFFFQAGKGFDFYTGNLFLKEAGKLKNVVIGHYNLQFGQGAIMWTGYGVGKSAMVVNTAKIAVGARPFRSASENGFLQGIAGTFEVNKHFTITPFFSLRKVDATLKTDSIDQPFVSALLTTGYHRTETEIHNKRILKEVLFGANLTVKPNQKMTIGVTGYQMHYNLPLIKSPQFYNQFGFKGNEQTAFSFSYQLNLSRFYFYGEEAKVFNSGYGTINGVLVSITPKVTLNILHRFYSKGFSGFYSQGFCEASTNNNEQGLYSGLNIKLSSKIELSTYVDYFNFEWLKYRIDSPSNGVDLFTMLSYSPSKKAKVELRYSEETKQLNSSEESTIITIDQTQKSNYRLSYSYALNQNFSVGNRIDYVAFREGQKSVENGMALSVFVAVQTPSKKLGIESRYTLFDTDSYNSRIYATEKDLLYSYSTAMFQNAGSRFYVNLKASLLKNLSLGFRYSIYDYRNMEQIGSDYDVINGNIKSDLKAQVRYQF